MRLAAAVDALDRRQQRGRVSAPLVAVLLRWDRTGAGRWSALLTHYAFASLLPALLLLVTGLGLLLAGDEELQRRVLDTAVAQVPVLGDQLRDDVTSLTGSAPALAVGVLGALYGAGGVLRSTRGALDDVAEVPAGARVGWLGSHGSAALVGVLLLLVLLATTLAAGTLAATGVLPLAGRVLSVAGGLVVGTGVFLAVFRVLRSDPPPLRRLLPGAVVAAAGWSALHVLGAVYVTRVVAEASLTYGAFATVIGLLAWLYVLARVVLLGAVLNATLEHRDWPVPLRGSPSPVAGAPAPR